MPEIKHNFLKGRMNKDLDERLVPNGEYRDAHNVEVVTSESSNIGTVQTCLGNRLVSDLTPDDNSICVASIVDDKTNNAYYFITSNIPPPVPTVDHTISSDLIVEYNNISNETLPVIVDIYNVQTRIRREHGASWACTNRGVCGNYVYSIKTVGTGLRVGMEVNVELVGHPTWVQSSDKPIITAISNGYDGKYIATDSRIRDKNGVELLNSVMGTAWEDHQYPAYVNFTTPRALNFHKDRLITGVNIVDDMLFWTDNYSEPKKVNITRGKQGSVPTLGICDQTLPSWSYNTQNPYTHNGTSIPGTTHTELVVNEEISTPVEYIQEKYITVIKKSPLTPLKLEMYDSIKRFNPTTGLPNNVYARKTNKNWWGNDPQNPTNRILTPLGITSNEWNMHNILNPNGAVSGTPLYWDERMAYFNWNVGNISGAGRADYRVGDILLLTDDQDAAIDSTTGENLDFDGDDVRIKLQVISSDSTAAAPTLVNSPNNGNLHVKVLHIDPSIQDEKAGWWIRLEDKTQSLYELKFPKFGYRYKYEDGEYSTFSPFSELAFLPQKFDYHPKKGYNLGMINGLRQLFIKDFIPSNMPLDVVSIDILYKESDSPNIYTIRSFEEADPEWGEVRFEIKDDLIHASVASNQLLRPWDNVPRKALAQELTGNRIVYGNYTQNYNLTKDNDEKLIPSFKAVIECDPVSRIGFPETSLKSMRTYQLGIVYKDIYGRETPVITHPSGVVKADAAKAVFNNKFSIQTVTPPPSWADSFKYFVKEVSNEYYNLAMDRWYYAGDDNIWLSFPSEDRNKIDDETTIILKKTSLSNEGVPTSGFVPDTPRYKILAIENEAPDFIKTVKTSMGKLSLDTTIDDADPSNLASNGVGSVIANSIFPFKNFDQIQINKTAWEKSPFSSLQNTKNQSGYLNSSTNKSSSFMVRLIKSDGTKLSHWYDITNLTFESLNLFANPPEGYFTIKIDGVFKDDVLFATSLSPSTTATSNSTTGIIADLELEIGKKTLENKAQFDGRFFVKVERDDEGNVRKYIMGISTPYLASENAVSSGLADDANVLTWRITDSKQLFFNAYNCSYTPNGTVGTYTSTLAGVNAQEGYDIRTIGDWVDLIDAQSNGHTIGGVNSIYAGGLPTRSRWYIDLEPNWHNNQGSGGQQNNHPGVGAQLGSDRLHISWSGIYSGLQNHSYNRDVGRGFPHEQPFIDLLETKGRKFRFTNDPDNIVYTITDWSTHDCFNTRPWNNSNRANTMKRWRMTIDPPFGTGATTTLTDANGVQYTWQPTNPYTSIQYNDPSAHTGFTGTVTWTGNPSAPSAGTPNILGSADEGTSTGIEFIEPYYSDDNEMPTNPAIWETEPKEDVGLDIYYEIGQTYPVNMKQKTGELYIQPGAKFNAPNPLTVTSVGSSNCEPFNTYSTSSVSTYATTGISIGFEVDNPPQMVNIPVDTVLSFTNPDGTIVTATAIQPHQSTIQIGWPTSICVNNLVHGEKQTLLYYNCYTFGNGVESNRIRDLYNAVKIDKGVKASTTLAEVYEEEKRKSGLIFSGIYNSMNGINRLNQFIMAEDITKDLNPAYGSIQKLHTRDDDLITLCEDKIIKVLANKDALYNADDSKNITASSNVLGYAKPFVGEFGISKNPESFASESFRAYFTDKQRGAVLRLSRDGLTSISEHGMKDWFADSLKFADKIVGNYDSRKSLYNVTLHANVSNDDSFEPYDFYTTGTSYPPLAKKAPTPALTPGLTIDIPPALVTTTTPPTTIVEPPLPISTSTTTKFERIPPDLKYDPTGVRITDIQRPSDFIPVEFIPGETFISEGESEGGGGSQDTSDSGNDSGGDY